MTQLTNKKGLRRGDSLRDAAAHAENHGRRDFLKGLGLVGATGFLLNRLPVGSLNASALTAALSLGNEERVLVLIRLKGGNDGLNTLIPVADHGLYQSVRPTLGLNLNDALRLTDELRLNPQLAPLRRFWDDDRMHVINNVGYPEQNLSHFRSSDIWASASDADENIPSGVLGRYFEEEFPDFLTSPPADPPAIQIGGPANLLFKNSDAFNYAVSTSNPQQLYEIAQTGRLYDVNNLPDCTYGEQLGFVRAVANTTFRYAGVLATAYDAGANNVAYLNDRLGDQLALVARMLKGGLKTQLFVVELDGFDTHAEQANLHAELLDSLAQNTDAFFRDLAVGGHDERVLGMTFSEFGRRVAENGSRGTDHGTSAPLFLFGAGLNGSGWSGGASDLNDVDENDNMRFRVDFREVYATVLTNWLCIPAARVDALLGGSFNRLPQIGLSCQGQSTSTGPAPAGFPLKAYRSGGELVLEYDLPRPGTVTVHLYDVSGRNISSPFRGRRAGGAQVQRLMVSNGGLNAGLYVVGVEYEGRVVSRKISWFR